MVGGLQMIVLSFEFHQNRLSGFGAVGGRNLPIPVDLYIGLYNILYYRTSRDAVRSRAKLRMTSVSSNCCYSFVIYFNVMAYMSVHDNMSVVFVLKFYTNYVQHIR